MESVGCIYIFKYMHTRLIIIKENNTDNGWEEKNGLEE